MKLDYTIEKNKDLNFNEKFLEWNLVIEIRDDYLVLFTYSGSLIIRSFWEKKFANFSIENEKKEEEEWKITIPKKNLLFLISKKEKKNNV